MAAHKFRLKCRSGQFSGPTTAVCGELDDFAQANLIVMQKDYAYDFLKFCTRNRKPCPVLEVLEAGQRSPDIVASGADLATDLPKYRVFVDGNFVEETTCVDEYWNDQCVAFLLGCSFSFESALQRADLSVKHVQEGKNVPMYITNIACQPSGIFSGDMVVSMRPYTYKDIPKVVQVTSRYPMVHGAPIHIGDPKTIGIKDINKPDFGDAPSALAVDEVPIFWACGVTPMSILIQAKPVGLVITHSPGHMFVCDVKNETFSFYSRVQLNDKKAGTRGSIIVFIHKKNHVYVKTYKAK